MTLALTAAADKAAAAATVISLSVFLAAPDSSDDAALSPADAWTACNCTQHNFRYAALINLKHAQCTVLVYYQCRKLTDRLAYIKTMLITRSDNKMASYNYSFHHLSNHIVLVSETGIREATLLSSVVWWLMKKEWRPDRGDCLRAAILSFLQHPYWFGDQKNIRPAERTVPLITRGSGSEQVQEETKCSATMRNILHRWHGPLKGAMCSQPLRIKPN